MLRRAGNCGNQPWEQDRNGWDSAPTGPRVSAARHLFARDNLASVNVPRRCSRPGCAHFAVATLTYVYADSTAVVGPLATAREPHSWDLCIGHASRITAPRGWDLVRHAAPLPMSPDEDDLVALADAVREGRIPVGSALSGFSDHAAAHAFAPQQQVSNGRRRGHLRVLPDPAE